MSSFVEGGLPEREGQGGIVNQGGRLNTAGGVSAFVSAAAVRQEWQQEENNGPSDILHG